MIPAIADKGSLIDNTPFLIFLALIGAAVGARWLANHLYDRRRAVEAAMRRHPAGTKRYPLGMQLTADEVDDLQAEWDTYLAAVEAKRHES
jgi:hypothetical protein